MRLLLKIEHRPIPIVIQVREKKINDSKSIYYITKVTVLIPYSMVA